MIYDHWVILLYTVAAVITGSIVSLVAPQVDSDKLDLFYGLTRTPVVEEEEILNRVLYLLAWYL